MSYEVKPCPFCGRDARQHEDFRTEREVECEHCGPFAVVRHARLSYLKDLTDEQREAASERSPRDAGRQAASARDGLLREAQGQEAQASVLDPGQGAPEPLPGARVHVASTRERDPAGQNLLGPLTVVRAHAGQDHLDEPGALLVEELRARDSAVDSSGSNSNTSTTSPSGPTWFADTVLTTTSSAGVSS